MDGTRDVSVERLRSVLGGDLDQLLQRITDSVNSAAPGRLIADSEELARQAIHDFGRAAYQAAMQEKVSAAEAAFPPSEGSSDGKAM